MASLLYFLTVCGIDFLLCIWEGFSKGAFANTRGAVEKRGRLTETDVDAGRLLASRHLKLSPEVDRRLHEAAAAFGVTDALGVHIRRTDKGKEAPSNLSLSAEEVAARTFREAQLLEVGLLFDIS